MTGLPTLTLTEARLMLRDVASLFFVLALPLGIYLVFGLPEWSREPSPAFGGTAAIDTFFPSLALMLAFGMLGFFSLPAYLGEYRAKGVLRRLSTTPVSPLMLIIAQVLVNLVLAVVAVALLVAVAAVVMGRPMPQSLPWLALSLVLGAASLFAVGLLIAAVAPSARAAQLLGHLPLWPMMFLAGAWIPKEQLPDFLSRIGDYTPLSAFRESAQAAWVGTTPQAEHLLVMVAVTVIAGVAAAKLFRWE